MTDRFSNNLKRALATASVCGCVACVPLLGACEQNSAYEADGYTKTKTVKTIDTPTEKTKITTTHEKDTTTVPR